MTRRSRIILWTVAVLFWLIGLFLAPWSYGQSCVTSSQVTLTGNLRGSNGLPTSNATLTLTPSQAGFISGCGINVPTAATCGTSTDGSVIQTGNPQTAPQLSTSGTGTLPSGVYYVVFEWYDSLTHVTLPSPEARLTLSMTESLVVSPPASGVPATAAGMSVFIGTTSGGETYQGQSTGSGSYVQSSPLTGGASPATTNNTVCVVTANDAVWPTGTGYIAGLTDSNGNAMPGFPMQWQLMGPGTTINLSNGLPYYHGVVTYPVPVLAQPQNHGQQSITGPLSLSGYNLTNVGRIGVGTGTPGYGLDAAGAGINGAVNADTGFLINGGAGTTGQAPCSDGSYIDQFCTFITSLPTLYYQKVYNSANTLMTQVDALKFGADFALSNTLGPPVGTAVDLEPTSVTAGSYSCANVTFDANGRATSASNGNCAGQDEYGTLSGCSFPNDGGGLNCTAGTITWGTAFADTSYIVGCWPMYSIGIAGGTSTQPVIDLNATINSTSQITLTEGVAQGSSGGYLVSSSYGLTIICHAHHN